jgi:hypothetical protein
LNVTKNYTVTGNWTRTVLGGVTITGIEQATDSAISPDGKHYYVVTGYMPSATHFGGYTCSNSNNNCQSAIGYITTFTREPSDGTLMWKTSQR